MDVHMPFSPLDGENIHSVKALHTSHTTNKQHPNCHESLSKVACTTDFWCSLAGATDQGQHQVAALQQGLQSTSFQGACREASEPAPSAGAPGLATGAPASVRAAPHVAATSAAMSRPKQTLEEMAAWLDAQLAAAPGKLCCLDLC